MKLKIGIFISLIGGMATSLENTTELEDLDGGSVPPEATGMMRVESAIVRSSSDIPVEVYLGKKTSSLLGELRDIVISLS